MPRAGISGPEAFHTDALGIVEINADDRIAARVAFDLDDIDAAFEELDARYLAGEAAAHAHTWSVVTQDMPRLSTGASSSTTTPDWVNIDHRRATAFEPGDMTAYIHATWDVAPDINIYIEAVHRLSDLGAVFTQVAKGTSQEGFDAEWRDVILLTVEGDLITRVRNLRRGRPRRRARKVRRTQPTGASTRERRDAGSHTHDGCIQPPRP